MPAIGWVPYHRSTPVASLEPSPPFSEVGSPSPLISHEHHLRDEDIFPKSQSKGAMKPGFEFRPGRPEPGLPSSESSPLVRGPGWPLCLFLQAPAQMVPGRETHPEGKERSTVLTQALPSLPKQTKPRVSLLSGDFPKVPGLFPGGGTRNKQTGDPKTERERRGTESPRD